MRESDTAVHRATRLGPTGLAVSASRRTREDAVHPAWRAFIRLCDDIQHGEIECLKIQDGLPVLAEVVKKKIKFTE